MVKTSNDSMRSGLRDESAMSTNNNVTFEGENEISVNKQRLGWSEVEGETGDDILLDVDGIDNTMEPQDVPNSVLEDGEDQHWTVNGAINSDSRNQWDNRLPSAPPTMDIMETTSSVAATGPPSFSSHRSILSNYSGSSDDDLHDVGDGSENELPGSGVSSNCQSLGNSNNSSLFSSRAQRIQAQLLHQRRLQNTAARATRSHQVVMGKDELQSWMEAMTSRLEKAVQEVLTQQRKDFDRVTSLLQSESQKHTNIEARLHAQLMLQSESMVAMELKLMRLETKIQQKEQSRSRLRFSVIDEEVGVPFDNVPARTTHVLSSGASLVSAVTATSGLEDGGEDEDEAANGSEVDEQSSSTTPNPVSSNRQTIDSILHNPIPIIQSQVSTVSDVSTRAIRAQPADDASSLATSFTNSTLPSTVVTASNPNAATTSTRRRSSEIDEFAANSMARSRSQSPLTVPSMTTASVVPSVASSVLTTAAVASAREFRSRRHVGSTIPSGPSDQSTNSRPLSNRVVSFVPPTLSNEVDSASMADTLTLPDEIDNVSDIVDAFAASSNRWREEYETRLDSIQKRFSRE